MRDEDSTSCVAAVETAEELGLRRYTAAWRRGWSRARSEVCLGHAAVWIWNLADEHFPGAVQIVDFYRARQHLWTLSAKLFPNDEGTIRRIWRAHGLKTHLVESFKISNDPEFVGKREAIVGLYLNPPEHAIVLSVEEKSQIQALDRTQPGLPLRNHDPRLPAQRHDHVVCRSQHPGREGHQSVPGAASSQRMATVPGVD